MAGEIILRFIKNMSLACILRGAARTRAKNAAASAPGGTVGWGAGDASPPAPERRGLARNDLISIAAAGPVLRQNQESLRPAGQLGA
jgi:hypothetical protein